ncbi:scyllo-inositol 2-dehydrogenase (NAD(+)) [Roseobacter fucihabitans]|uniref:Scyllo-inositol 2-dehydrogenase (NAD(+)) n=1 Tax=Roseobacter fucihabitans TaxID=1537242 RepID=A0ABZ2BPG4_9RHOB|nr:Gfo/Idh/MocA family oxidoreductase [Roseobacter litoralis]MBC6963657.1 1,5-anhydro-D-fructose reductase [Roseobacter litoralis]
MKRILVLGGGLIGIRHVEAVEAHPGCTLVGLVDPDTSIAPHLKRFVDMAEVTEPVDGVIIATPTGLHARHGIYAASRGWPMLIEKPVASDMAGAQALAHAVVQAGVGSLVGHHRRYHAPVQQLKALIDEGRIGTPVCANLIWAMRKPEGYFDGNWRTAGGSPVMINLVHDIDTLRFVLGDILAVTGLRGAGLRGSARIESGAVALAFANGATGTISFADTTPSPWGFEAGTGENPNIGATGQDMMWIMGTAGAVSFPSLTLWSGTDWGQAATRVPLAVEVNTTPPLAAQLNHFLDVIDGATPLIDVADATRTLAITLDIEAQLSPTQEEGAHGGVANS